MKIDIDTLREDLFTDFIQEYNHLTNDQVSELVDIELNKIIKQYDL
jgi:5'(3')-deoxyribonucleotidase